MDLQLKDQVIIVTGGASGIGESIVRSLASEGAIPVIFDLNEARTHLLIHELDLNEQESGFSTLDLTNEAAVEAAIDGVHARYGRIDGLVNNAGVNDKISIKDSVHDFESSLQKNLVQCFSLVHHALAGLMKSSGAIVNIGTKCAVTGQGGTSGYVAAKGGLVALTREWALELRHHGIRVNTVMPAEVLTPMYQDWLDSLPNPEATLKDIESSIPLGNRMTTCQEIADMVIFLLSPRSSHTTGQIMYVDGGYTHLDRACTQSSYELG